MKISVGKVPAKVAEIDVEEGSTVEQVMKIGARQCGFSFTTDVYNTGGKDMMDVPFLNGKELCARNAKNAIVEIFWDTVVSDGDVVLIIPKIRGNN